MISMGCAYKFSTVSSAFVMASRVPVSPVDKTPIVLGFLASHEVHGASVSHFYFGENSNSSGKECRPGASHAVWVINDETHGRGKPGAERNRDVRLSGWRALPPRTIWRM